MKIFSSFDTGQKEKLLQQTQKQHGENTHLIERSSFFLYMRVIFPIIVGVLGGIGSFLLLYLLREVSLVGSIVIGFFVCVSILLLFKAFSNYINYKMDYVIVTPNKMLIADQTGVFKRSVASIDTNQIKSMYSQKGGLIQSIFNNGSLIFLIDAGASSKRGKITIDHVFSPEKSRDRINQIVKSFN